MKTARQSSACFSCVSALHPAPWRNAVFRAADCLFLAGIGALTTWIMHMTHELHWGFVPCALLGMLAAMLVQTAIAWLIAPLLGSIESMVPSMVVAMLAPMSVCALHLTGVEPGQSWSLLQGAGFGFTTFVILEAYGAACRRRFESDFREATRSS